MKKHKRTIIISLVIAVFLVLTVPLPATMMDGGSTVLNALTYKIIHYHRISDWETNAYEVGTGIEIFGKEIYKNTHIEREAEKKLIAENGSYIIYEQVVYEPDCNVNGIYLTVVDKNSGKEIFSATPCRALDYHGTEFVENSNDFIVKSSDIGEQYYKFDEKENTWNNVDF